MIFIPEHLFISGKKIIDFLAVKKYNDIAGKKGGEYAEQKDGKTYFGKP